MLYDFERNISRVYQRLIFRRSFFAATRCVTRRSDTPFRLAIVGSGPAGFYTAFRVLSKMPHAQIDMYESLPVPFGLVRHGVAPDHPEVKNCLEKFDAVASSPNFTFLGNVSVGCPRHLVEHCNIELQPLTRHYHSILFAYGASEDNKLGIPGESTLGGIHSARQFVGWYNGLPDCIDLGPDLTRGDEAVIIGQGNVALDIARIMLENIDLLRKTDITDHALEYLAKSKIRKVHIVGRRGPMQAAFTIKEVRELMNLDKVVFHLVNPSLIPTNLNSLPRAAKRLMEVLSKGTPSTTQTSPKHWSLDSCLSPKKFVGKKSNPSIVGSTEFNVNLLSAPFDTKSSVVPTGDVKMLPSDVVFRSVGYRSVSLLGFAEAGVQFDERRGVVGNDGLGRAIRDVTDRTDRSIKTQHVPGMYCAGWVSSGPTGVIASTMQDAFTTGDTIIQDWLSGASFLNPNHGQEVGGWNAVKHDIGPEAARAITWDQWRQIDRAERDRGRARGKKREKFTDIRDMLAAAIN